mgnify:CR=1 FL=1
MSNTYYVDCNRTNSQYKNDNNNEWTYKLNTEMLLPKGTNIEVQNSFINKQGINGGSVEIDKDILEELQYNFYITEQPHITPVNQHTSDANSWFRPTLACDADTFRGNFSSITGEQVECISRGDDYAQGLITSSDYYGSTLNKPDFGWYGGSGAILPHCKWVYDGVADDYFIMPVVKKFNLFIPKGVYGIGQLAQLIEDQFNGVRQYNSVTKTLGNEEDTRSRMDTTEYNGNFKSIDRFNGQLYNRPFLTQVDAMPRYYNTAHDRPSKTLPNNDGEGCDTFLAPDIYANVMDWLRDFDSDTKSYGNAGFPSPNNFDGNGSKAFYWQKMNGKTIPDADLKTPQTIMPFYMLNQVIDLGITGADGITHVKDSDTVLAYNLYEYEEINNTTPTTNRLIGTSNFGFKYDSEKNGFSINGLHNVMRGPSHDRYGSKVEASGQPVINFKKMRSDGLVNSGWLNTDASKEARAKIIGCLNQPQTRDGGIMIQNFARTTAINMSTRTKKIHNEDAMRFSDYFTDIVDAKKAWETTIWFRLGFDYDQLNTPIGRSNIYDGPKPVPDYGFTTDSALTNDIIPTVSTLANPLSFKADGAGDSTPSTAGFQLYNNLNYATPKGCVYAPKGGSSQGLQGAYANSMLLSCAMYPTIISDVGGIIANKLPQLSTHGYYLLTCDILDNYKDNVKKGDVFPLLGIIAKSSLSNQDFITNQQDSIIQVISQDKVINKIHCKVLNPDLTAPDLEENSSIMIKITVPFTTPLSILEQMPNSNKLIKELIAQQNMQVGN